MHEFRSGTPALLTPELAHENPELFKTKLIEALGKETSLGGKIWNALEQRGRTRAAKISLDPNQWISRSVATTGVIELGIAPMPAHDRSDLLFEDLNFQGDREIVYRFMHELGHLMHPKLWGLFQYTDTCKHPDSIRFVNMVMQMRRAGKGLSALGSQSFYQHTDQQAVEDVVELMTMYAIDPDYLKRYLLFLMNPAPLYQAFRTKNQLITPTREVAQEFFATMKRSFEFFLDDTTG